MSRIDSLVFYSISAQVIPVLFIAVAIEMRLLGRTDAPPQSDVIVALTRYWAFWLLVWGEWQALSVLSGGHADADAHAAVTTALLAAAIMLAIEPTKAFARSVTRAMPWAVRPYAQVARGVFNVIVAITLFALGVGWLIVDL